MLYDDTFSKAYIRFDKLNAQTICHYDRNYAPTEAHFGVSERNGMLQLRRICKNTEKGVFARKRFIFFKYLTSVQYIVGLLFRAFCVFLVAVQTAPCCYMTSSFPGPPTIQLRPNFLLLSAFLHTRSRYVLFISFTLDRT